MERDREIVVRKRKIFNFYRITCTIADQLDGVEPELQSANEAFARVLVTFKDDDVLRKMAQQELGTACEVQRYLGRRTRTKW
jgi:hypothetical protein